MPSMPTMKNVVDLDRGLVSRRAYSDQEIYRVELERVFHRCWLFLGHESAIPRPGDYLTNYMGEDGVIVWRDQRGKIHAFLNTCLHRGNTVCLYDLGRATSLTCSYHGWTYSCEGKLVGVPFFNEAYLGDLDREQWGLVEVPKVQSYGGFIFGCWDAGAVSLDDYLGELRWYFDAVLLFEEMGGLEAIPGWQRQRIAGNWKTICDNFAGDHYHFSSTHASVVQGVGANDPPGEAPQGKYGYFAAVLAPAHNLGGIYTDDSQYESDLARARQIAPEVVAWVTERHRYMLERTKDAPAKPSGYSHGNVFPNLNFTGGSGAFGTRNFHQCHPRGPLESEIWDWHLVERAAPQVVKELAAAGSTRGQAGAGVIGQDDWENFERGAMNTLTPLAQQLPFHYGMSLGYDGEWPGYEDWHIDGLPGQIGPRFWEGQQRHFYAYWARSMGYV